MRYIDKSNRCLVFDDFVAAYKGRLRNNWEKFKKIKGSKEVRLQLHKHIWLSQKGLCAYCEQEIPSKINAGIDDLRTHFDHIRKRELYPQYTFIFENIVLSCEGFDLQTTEEDPSKRDFCGHFKDKKLNPTLYNDTLFLNPTEHPDIESYFWYDSQAIIEPSLTKSAEDQARAKHTIDVLGLNNQTLVDMRYTEFMIWLEKTEQSFAHDFNESAAVLTPFFSYIKQKFS